MQAEDQIVRRLKVKDLHTLQVVAEAGSMVKAAASLGLSQSAISKTISELEQTLGAQLLERSARGVGLTEAGLVLVARGRVVFDEIKQGVEDIVHLTDPTRGQVRIGTTEPMTVVVAEVIELLSRQHPRISYRIDVGSTDAMVRQLRERSLDIMIARWIPSLAADDLRIERLFEAPLAVLAAGHHPLAQRKNLRLSELMDEQWTLSPPDGFLAQLIANLFRRHGLALPRSTVTTASIYMRLNLLVGGHFLSVLPVTLLRHQGNRSWLAALDVELREAADPIASVTLAKRRGNGALRLFSETARAVAKDIS